MSRPDVAWYLTISPSKTDDVLVLALAGRLSSHAASDLNQALQTASDGDSSGVVLDLSDVDYVSSAALHALEAGGHALHGRSRLLVLCGLRPTVKASFLLAGPLRHVTIETTREQAIAKVLGSG